MLEAPYHPIRRRVDRRCSHHAALRYPPLSKKELANSIIRAKNGQPGISLSHTKELPRLKRIEGQVRGLQQMIENERDCLEVAHQISAVIAAMRRVQGDMLRDYLRECANAALTGTLSAAKARRLIDEMGDLLTKWR